VTPAASAATFVTRGHDGALGGVDAAAIVNFTAAEVPPPGFGLNTVTDGVPAVARSDLVMLAWSTVRLTNVVVRVAPFQRTTDVGTKPVPLTVSVSAALPVVAPVGDRLPTVGTELGPRGRSTRSVSKVAFTSVSALTVTTHALVPVHAPVQPMKVEPEVGLAVSVIVAPIAMDCEQVAPQLMPAGALVIVPEPVPSFVTDSVMRLGVVVNVALTEVAAFTVTAQVPVPEQAPLQPAKAEPAVGVAVRVTTVPDV